MQHFDLILFAAVVLAPAAVLLLLDRIGAGRWAVLVGGAASAAVTGLALHQLPWLVPGQGAVIPVGMQREATQPGVRNVPAATETALAPPLSRLSVSALQTELVATVAALRQARADLEAERATHARAVRPPTTAPAVGDIHSARPAAATPADVASRLEAEQAAHARTQAALTGSEAQRTRMAERLKQAIVDAQSARNQADEATRRLVLAEATIARLEAASRASEGGREQPVLPVTPAPFSGGGGVAPPVEQPRPPASTGSAAPNNRLTDAAPPPSGPPGAVAPRESASPPVAPTAHDGGARPPAASAGVPEIRRSLDGGLVLRQLVIEPLSERQLVQSRQGSYYRIACRSEVNARRIVFDAGAFTIRGGDGPIEACVRALRQGVLESLPSAARWQLYVQGFASPSSFVKPQRMPPRSEALASVSYLPRTEGAAFSPRPRRQSIDAAGFANKELPILRAAHVAGVIETSTRGALRADVLEGELKPSSDEASRGFDIVLYVAW